MLTLQQQFCLCLKDNKLTQFEISLLRRLVDFQAPDFSPQKIRTELFNLLQQHASSLDGAQMLNWVQGIDKILESPTQTMQPSQVCFAPGNDCMQLIIDTLQSAKSSIDICVFTISDNRISDVIIGLHRKGISIRVITDDEKMNDKGADILRFVDEQIPTKYDKSASLMHHKFALVDGCVLLTGSYNWTRSASDYNYENLLRTEDPALVQPFVQEFERLWQHPEIAFIPG